MLGARLELAAIAHDYGCPTRILGKLSGHVAREGELYRWQILEALQKFIEGFAPARAYQQAGEAEERPHRPDHCAGCRYPETLELLKAVAQELGQDPVLIGKEQPQGFGSGGLHLRQNRLGSRWRQADTGRRRKYYSILAAGRKELARRRAQWEVVNETLTSVWSPSHA